MRVSAAARQVTLQIVVMEFLGVFVDIECVVKIPILVLARYSKFSATLQDARFWCQLTQ